MYSSSQGIRRCRVIESKLSDYKCFTIIFFTTRSFTIDSAFLRRPFRHFSTKTLLLLRLYSSVIYPPIFISFFSSAFQPINNITFVLFHDFREHYPWFPWASKLVLLLAGIMIITCLPTSLQKVLQHLCIAMKLRICSMDLENFVVFYLLRNLNFLVNPLVYIWKDRMYRNAFYRTFKIKTAQF